MAQYFYNLHESNHVIEDEDGSEAANDSVAHARAIAAARDIMCGCVQAGELCVAWHIEIQDAVRRTVGIVKFRDAIAITGM